MPIFEFKCLKCEAFFEVLVKNSDSNDEVMCPACQSQSFERVISRTNFNMIGNSKGGGNKESSFAQTRTCSSGSCTTYEIPGPK